MCKMEKNTGWLRLDRRNRASPEWSDWHWQMENRMGSDEDAGFPCLVTPYYASLVRDWMPDDPIFRIAVRQDEEGCAADELSEDPLREDSCTPVPKLIRRYIDRAVVLATSHCASHCRYCDRKRFTGDGWVLSDDELAGIFG